MTSRSDGRHVVVVGGGFAGLGAAYAARERLGSADQVTVISATPTFYFAPSLIWTILGQSGTQHTFFLEDSLAAHNISFLRGEVQEIRSAQRQVITDQGTLSYDRLVIATGGRPDSSKIPGLAGEFRSAAWIAGEDSAMELRTILQRFETEPGPLVVGAAQGASYISAAYEIVLLMDSELRRVGVRNRAPIIFVTAEPQVGDLGFGQSAAPGVLGPILSERGIKVRANTAVERVEPHRVWLADGEVLETAAAVLMPPMGGVVDVWKSPNLTDEEGLIPVDERYRHIGHEDIYAVGIASYFAHPVPPLNGLSTPHTGYLSLRMGVRAGQNVAASLGYGQGAERALPFVLDLRVIDGGDDGAFLSSRGDVMLEHQARRLSGGTARAMKESLEAQEMEFLRTGSVDHIESFDVDQIAGSGQR